MPIRISKLPWQYEFHCHCEEAIADEGISPIDAGDCFSEVMISYIPHLSSLILFL